MSSSRISRQHVSLNGVTEKLLHLQCDPDFIQNLGVLYVTRSEVSHLLHIHQERRRIGLVGDSNPLQGAVVVWMQSDQQRLGQVYKTIVLQAQGEDCLTAA